MAFIEKFEETLDDEHLEFLIEHWRQHMDANFTGGDKVPDVFYALGCETRPHAPFNGASLRIPAYVDMTKAEIGQPIVGPTLTMQRGQTTGVLLSNAIRGCGADAIPGVKDNMSGWKPHDFTSTNLHTHGLHVSPQAPSDDVLIILDSKNKPHSDHAAHHGNHGAHHTIRSALDATSYAYRYELPDDHPVGTFWYHPHKHGSVAAQVGPGMAGALIVRAPESENDFDTLLADTCKITKADEEVVVLQSITYFETTGGDAEQGVFYPYGYYLSEVEHNFDPSTCHGLTPTKAASVPAMSVNGQVNPVITMDQGEIKRLRFVNASNGQTIVPQFVGEGAPEVYAIAVDGIALMPPTTLDSDPDAEYFKIDYNADNPDAEAYWTNAELITLAPGQRLDLLVKAGTTAGSFQLKGAAKGTVPMVVQGQDPNTADILTVTVTTDASTKEQSIPTIDLFRKESIKRPVPPAMNIDGVWPAATQSIEFKTIEENFKGSYPSKPAFVVNDQYFDVTVGDPAQIQLFKGDTDIWNVYSTNDAHIFHIHINSFQALGRSVYDVEGRVYLPPVTYKMPIWRDTIYVDSVGGNKIPGTSPEKKYDTYTPGTMVTMASKQVDFTGEFVLHCHNLFHEDNGMMLTVSILDPKTGGTDDA
ncbi:multicopper oxidase domain-containing protein [Tateyamaria omphalii]|uniref:multicopper oxidase family protein n=1 Tax=Tateyamaria omphalii TaxID=299262 RepID=UPI001C990758|nr:multicopper oxidase family protein [Tateyamaria omphalii]MBY5933539.1 multicopper oxidase domain-containing protein [Tateyamaria omphalii]